MTDMSKETGTQIFISYSHKDKEWLNRIKTSLKPLERMHAISVWDDTKINAGAQWREEITKALKEARVALLLVTSDFLASDFIAKHELPPLLEAAKSSSLIILWVAIGACHYEVTEIGSYQAVNDPKRPLNSLPKAKREKALVDICKQVESAIRNQDVAGQKKVSTADGATTPEDEHLLTQQLIAKCPYRGLESFRKEDEHLFFGRDTYINKLLESVKSKPLISVLGTSGIGKSSIVFAGLLPKVLKEHQWLVIAFRPLSSPFYNLAAELIPHVEPSMGEVDKLKEIQKLADNLEQGDIKLQNTIQLILKKTRKYERLLIVVDQFEEIFTLCRNEKIREKFLKLLFSILPDASTRTSLILTLRADFFDQALRYRNFADALQNSSLLLGPMTQRELKDAIEKPALNLNVKVESGLTERILKDVSSSPGELALLEFALTLLWSKQEHGILTHAAYDEIGGVDKALAGYAESVYQQLGADEQRRIKNIFVQLVRPGEGTKDTRRLATEREIGKENWGLVTRLADTRLVITGRNGSTRERTVEIVHEALIEGWTRLKEWMEDEREFRTWQEQLRTAIDLWKKNKQDGGLLLRGALLDEAIDWQQRKESERQFDAVSTSEKKYIKASLASRNREQAILDKRRRRITVASVVAAAFFLVLASLFYSQRRNAERNQQIAHFRQVAFQADAMRTQNPELLERSVLLVLEVLRQSPFLEAEQSLRRGFRLLPRLVKQVTDGGGISDLSFSPNGQFFATVSKDGTAKVWETATGKQISSMPHKGVFGKILFSPDGKNVATTSQFRTLSIWEANSGREIVKMSHNRKILDAAFSPDGTQIASASENEIIRIWDISSGKELRHIEPKEGVIRIAYSPKGRYLVSLPLMERVAHVWDINSGKEVFQIAHDGVILNMAFSPDGKYLATGSTDYSARLWDFSTGKEVARFMHGFTVNAMDFSPDGKYLATASEDGTARVWDINNQQELSRVEHEDDVHFIKFSPDGRYVASGCINKFDKKSHYFVARVWEAMGGREVARLSHADGFSAVMFSPDGKYVATASDDRTARIWEFTDSVGLTNSVERGDRSRTINNRLSSNNKYHVIIKQDGRARVWELGNSSEVLRQVSESIITLSPTASEASIWELSPNGRYIAELRMGRYEEPFVPNDSLFIWNLTDGHEVAHLKINEPEGNPAKSDTVTEIKFNPTGEFLALMGGPSGPDNGGPSYVRILGTDDLRETRRFNLESHGTHIVYSPDGRYLVTTDFKNTAHLWDVNSGQDIAQMHHEITDKDNGLGNLMDCAAFSSDGKLLATGSWDSTARIWDVSAHKEIARLPHESFLREVNFSPDNNYLATMTDDRIMRIWDVKSHEELTRFNGQDDPISSNRFSPNGRYLIKPTDGSAITTWLWKTEDLMQEACTRLTRNLSQEEWTQYFGDLAYHKTCPNLADALPVKENDQAASQQDSSAEAFEDDTDALYQSGSDRIDRGDYVGAIADMTKVIEGDPKNPDAYTSRAIAYGKKGEIDKALNDFAEAEKLGGDRANIYTNRSNLYADQGNTEQALSELEVATKADPHFAGSFFNRAQIYFKQKRYSEALADLNIVIKLEPNNTEALHRRGLIFYLLGDKRDAISDFKAMLQRATDDHTRQDAVKHLLELGESIESIGSIQRAPPKH